MIKKAIFGIVLILILMLPSSLIAMETSSKISDEVPKIGKIHVDMSAVLQELGYTKENLSTISEKLVAQIIRTYSASGTCSDDGDYYYTITPDSLSANAKNIIGSNTTVPYDSGVVTNSGASTNLIAGKACIIVGIWDWQGSLIDTPQFQNPYDTTYSSVIAGGEYTYVKTLTNSEATHYYVYS